MEVEVELPGNVILVGQSAVVQVPSTAYMKYEKNVLRGVTIFELYGSKCPTVNKNMLLPRIVRYQAVESVVKFSCSLTLFRVSLGASSP